MRSRFKSPKKENTSYNNLYTETIKRSPPKKSPTNLRSRIPLPISPRKVRTLPMPKKMPTTKKEVINLNVMEKEIETRLRSKLRIEFSERFHQLQDKYYRQIISVTDNVESSFIDNLKKLSNEAQNNNEREKIQNRIEKIENKIKHEEKKKLKLIKVIKKKESYLTMLNEKIESGLQTQEKLKNTQNSLSNLIKQNYMRNSDLFLELNLTREQNNIKKYYDEEPESFDDFDDQIDFGLSPRIEINDDEAYLGYSTTGTSCFSQGSYDDDIPTMVNLSSSSTKQFGTVEIQSLDQSNNILTT